MARLFDDGSSQYLEIDSAVITAVPFAMACWFRSDDDTASQMLIWVGDKDDSDDSYHALLIRGDFGDVVQARSKESTASDASTTTGFSANTWHYACGVWAADNDRRAYIDGGSKSTATGSRDPLGEDRTSIGRRGGISSGVFMSGRICEAGIWDLSNWPGATNPDKADEFERVAIPALAAGYSPAFFMLGLKAYWPLIRDEDKDRVGGYHLTAYNTPTIAAHVPRIIYPLPKMLPLAAPPAVAAGLPVLSGGEVHGLVFGGVTVR